MSQEVNIFDLTAEHVKKFNPQLYKDVQAGKGSVLDDDNKIEAQSGIEDLTAGQIKKFLPNLYGEIQKGDTGDLKESVMSTFQKQGGVIIQ